jgi:hypothetical protein
LSGSSSSLLVDDGRAVPIFGDPSAAEDFRMLGAEWEMMGHHATESIEELGISATSGVRYVEIDTPSKLTRGRDAPRLVPLRGFIDYLLGE